MYYFTKEQQQSFRQRKLHVRLTKIHEYNMVEYRHVCIMTYAYHYSHCQGQCQGHFGIFLQLLATVAVYLFLLSLLLLLLSYFQHEKHKVPVYKTR